MAIVQLGFVLAALATSLYAQTSVPSFTREGVVPVWGKHAQSLMPNDLVSIYGRNLAPADPCFIPSPPQGGTYPTEVCGTVVTVGGIPAGLLAVLENQINLKVPAEAPTSGEAAIVVTVRGVSSQPVKVPFGKPKMILSVVGPAYVHMPVWITLEPPYPYDVSYPYSLTPGDFGGGRFEVRHNGLVLKPLEIHLSHEQIMIVSGNLHGSIAPADSPRGRLPLHLQYRFDEPGQYEIRFIATRLGPGHGKRPVEVDVSDWIEIELLPYSDAQRRNWIQEQISKMPSSPGLLVGDAIPGLLAWPDQLALRAVLPQLYHSSDLVRRYVAASLTMFDDTLLRRELTPLVRAKGPTEEIARIVDGSEQSFEGGHQAFLGTFPPFLKSASPMAQAGALQYLVWGQNHDWGKTQEFQNELSSMVLDAATNVLEHGDARSQQTLALALGSIKSDAARDFLWKMIESGTADEQSRIALTWIGDSRDLPRLAGLLTKADPTDRYGYKNSSLAYSLHRAYGDASLPWLKQAARDTKQIWVRTSCAKELVLADQSEGFEFLLQAMDEMPSFKAEAVQFIRDRFPELRGAGEDIVLAFLKTKARAQ
jgi:hypothetical protein